MNIVDRAWLAGLLEGEGCFYAHGPGRQEGYAKASLSMTDEDTVARAAALIGKEYVRQHAPSHAAKGQKPLFIINVSGDNAKSLMREVYPFMGKRRRAKIKEILG